MQIILLIGSPNVGKSMVFHRLTGRKVTISNYPGTTVEILTGFCEHLRTTMKIYDTPGMYSLYPITEEEEVTRQVLIQTRPSWILNIVDAKNLERMLPLTLELIQSGFPVILGLNMIDEAAKQGITIDHAMLSKLLNIPVCAMSALKNQGITELKSRLVQPSASVQPQPLPTQIDHEMFHQLTQEAQEVCHQVIKKQNIDTPWTSWDNLLLSPWSGVPIALLALYFIFYQLVGRFGAGVFVNIIDDKLFGHILLPLFMFWIDKIPSPALQQLLGGEFGVFTLGFRYAFAIILPIISIFFLVFSLLEDSGYLPRLAFLSDRMLKQIGLGGRGVIPFVLGLGCGTMAVAVTRTLETKRERCIATMLLALAIPCSAQLGVIMAILAPYPLALLVWLTTITVVFLWIGTLLHSILPGTAGSFYLELPPLRLPTISNSINKTMARITWYFWEILPMFIITSVSIWAGTLLGIFDRVITSLERVTTLLALPKETAVLFLFGFLRRDYGVAGLYDLQSQLSWPQLTIISVTLTLFVPCLAQFAIMVKERGAVLATSMLIIIVGLAFSIGLLLRWILI